MPKLPFSRHIRRRPPSLPHARIIVGLGNPGASYAGHRHNVGARAVEQVGSVLNLPLNQKSKLALVGSGVTAYGPVVVARPRTFMNESGRALQSLLNRYSATPQRLILIVDDLDLEVGRVRVRPSGGHGGQKGMRSIHEIVGSLDFPRVRIGIGRPYVNDAPSYHPDVVADHVLADPIPGEAEALQEAVRRAADAVIAILRDGVEAAMNEFNADQPQAPS